MTLRTALITLITLVLGLPLLQMVLIWVVGLLSALGDATAASVLDHINTATRIIWLASLVGLIVVLSLKALDQPDRE